MPTSVYISLFPSTAGSDYAPTTQQLSIQSGQPGPVCINLTVFDDNILEDIEDFAIVLSTADMAVVITRNLTTVFIPNIDSMCSCIHPVDWSHSLNELFPMQRCLCLYPVSYL